MSDSFRRGGVNLLSFVDCQNTHNQSPIRYAPRRSSEHEHETETETETGTETDTEDLALAEIEIQPEEQKAAATNSMDLDNHACDEVNQADEDVKIAISALNVMKTGAGRPARSTFDFTSPAFDPLRTSPRLSSLNSLDQFSSDAQRQAFPREYTPQISPPVESSPTHSHPDPSLPTTRSTYHPSRPDSPFLSGRSPTVRATSCSDPSTSASYESNETSTGPVPSVFFGADGNTVDDDGHPVNVVQLEDSEGGVFLQRVGRMPLVSGVVRAYERGKGTSRVVKYGADLVESSVTSLSGSLASKVGPERIAQIDRYAGAALDRLGQFGIQSPPNHIKKRDLSHSTCGPSPSDTYDPMLRTCSYASPDALSRTGSRRRKNVASGYHPISPDGETGEENGKTSQDLTQLSGSHNQLYQQAGVDQGDDHRPEVNIPNDSPGGRLIPVPGYGRSRWQSMLVEASMTAGGIGAAVSEESMKSLKYCLQWLHYATAHLDHQITVLRDFIASLNVSRGSSDALISASAVHTLADIKKEVVETIRKVVDVVSKYAGGALPEQAKQFVRKSILSLPLRWASTIQAESASDHRQPISSQEGGRHAAVDCLPNTRSVHSHSLGRRNNRGTTEIAADRVLTFAVESLDMLKSVTGIFAESVDRAEAWVERLRVIGIQYHNQRATAKEQTEADRRQSNRSVIAPRRETLRSCSVDSSLTMQTAVSKSTSSLCEIRQQQGWERSRDSSTSACDATSSSSMISGGDQSSCSFNTANTTITSSTSNRENFISDRTTVKRRKANDGNAKAGSDFVSHTSHPSPTHWQCDQAPAASLLTGPQAHPSMGAGLERNSTSTLKKLLLDHNVNHNDEEWRDWSEPRLPERS